MNAASLTAALKEEALRLKFDLADAAPAQASPDFDRLQQWVADGCAGEMRYFAQRLDAYRHPAHLLDAAKSILMLGVNYRTVEPAAAEKGTVPCCGTVSRPCHAGPVARSGDRATTRRSRQARVSRHAWGQDYHEVIRSRLHKLADFHRRLVPTARVRGVVDTAPLLERQFGRLAGLGWIGKNTMLINQRLGSWFFLAALLTTEELEYDAPAAADHCGACRACLDACPTGALAAPHRLDARKCLSYLTIELRGPLPADFRATSGGRLFGCDACQEACPWNRQTPATAEPSFQPGPGMNPADLAEMLSLDEAAFRRRFHHTPLWRARREGILRNAGVLEL